MIHHGIDASAFSSGDGDGDDDGEYMLFSGRMSPDKGAHRAIEVARKAGVRLLLAAKMREPWETPLLRGVRRAFLGDAPSTSERFPTSASSSCCEGQRRCSSRSDGTSLSAW